MKILITGATGFTGRRILPLLAGKGNIKCYVRPTSDIENIEKYGYEIVLGDLNDLDSLKKAMTGCEALINVASIGFGHARGIVKTAEEAGIKRAIFISTTALFTHLSNNSKLIRLGAEKCIKASRLNWTILRPTMIYGAPDDRNMIRLLKFIDRSPVIPIFGHGNYLQQPVYVGDIAKAVVAALFNEGAIRREFNVSGKYPNTYNEIIDLTAKALGRKIMKIHVPLKPSIYIFKLYEKLYAKPVLRTEQIMRLNEDKSFDYSEARSVFEYNPLPFEKGIAREIELYRNER